MSRNLVLALSLPLMLTGCGPAISEMRMASALPKPKDCSLQFVQTEIADLSPMGGKYQVLGYVTLSEIGIQDPFAERYRAIVRPRACSMGGEAVTMMASATSSTMGMHGSGTVYAVVRAKTDASAAPTAF